MKRWVFGLAVLCGCGDGGQLQWQPLRQGFCAELESPDLVVADLDAAAELLRRRRATLVEFGSAVPPLQAQVRTRMRLHELEQRWVSAQARADALAWRMRLMHAANPTWFDGKPLSVTHTTGPWRSLSCAEKLGRAAISCVDDDLKSVEALRERWLAARRQAEGACKASAE